MNASRSGTFSRRTSRTRTPAEAARLAEEQAERERQAAEAARLAEEQAERERQQQKRHV
ncbi:hypothetical protein J4731_01060 [Providencia rettgeri]|nr:hypothetical protein [Providencia rettgeri]